MDNLTQQKIDLLEEILLHADSGRMITDESILRQDCYPEYNRMDFVEEKVIQEYINKLMENEDE